VWVAAPGEQIISTYPFGTYAASSGTSFSAPFVSGAAALLLDVDKSTGQTRAANAIANAVPVGDGMGNGRLDLVLALRSATTK
jgi:thermitase